MIDKHIFAKMQQSEFGYQIFVFAWPHFGDVIPYLCRIEFRVMTILFLSDTHGLHRRLKSLPTADVLVHAGDVSRHGKDHEVEDFIRWFCGLEYPYKVFIAGNHDFYLEEESATRIRRMLPENTFYLCDSGVEIEGIRFWGSPVSSYFFGWAFNRRRGKDIRKHWTLIPPDTDILVTHSPPHGILDKTQAGDHAGCEDLLKTIKQIHPKYHLFGHIHEAYGRLQTEYTTFVNGSMVDLSGSIVNQPILLHNP